MPSNGKCPRTCLLLLLWSRTVELDRLFYDSIILKNFTTITPPVPDCHWSPKMDVSPNCFSLGVTQILLNSECNNTFPSFKFNCLKLLCQNIIIHRKKSLKTQILYFLLHVYKNNKSCANFSILGHQCGGEVGSSSPR